MKFTQPTTKSPTVVIALFILLGLVSLLSAVRSHAQVLPHAQVHPDESQIEFGNRTVRLLADGRMVTDLISENGSPITLTPVITRVTHEGKIEAIAVLDSRVRAEESEASPAPSNPFYSWNPALFLSLGVSNTRSLSGGVGLLVGDLGSGVTHDGSSVVGVLLSGDLGLNGSTVGVGFGQVLTDVQSVSAAQLTLSRYYGGRHSRSTYVGSAIQTGLFLVNASLGVMRRIDAPRGSLASRWLFEAQMSLKLSQIIQ